MRRIIALVATLCLLLTVVSVPAVAETEGTDWSSKEKLTITLTTPTSTKCSTPTSWATTCPMLSA